MNNLFKIADKYQQNPNVKVAETKPQKTNPNLEWSETKSNPNLEWSETSPQEHWKEIKRLKQLITNLRKKYNNDIQYYLMREESFLNQLKNKDDELHKLKTQIKQLQYQLKQQQAQLQYQLKKDKVKSNIT